MRSIGSILAVTCLSLALAACGDDSTGTGGAGGGGQAEGGGTSQGGGNAGTGGNAGIGGGSADIATAFCEAGIAHDEECDAENVNTLEQCLADEDTTCFSNFRPEVQQPLVDCLAARECGDGDDDCFFDVGAEEPTAGQEEYLDACGAKLAECPGTFGDDRCFITVFTTEAYAAMSACLDDECADVDACLSAAFDEVCPG